MYTGIVIMYTGIVPYVYRHSSYVYRHSSYVYIPLYSTQISTYHDIMLCTVLI